MPPPNASPSLPPNVGEARFNEALRLHQAGRLDEAAALYKYVAKHFPAQPDPWRLLGLVAFQKGDARSALDLFDKAIKLDPANAQYRFDRARALKAQNRLEASLLAYDKAVALDPVHADAWAGRGNLLRELGRPQEALASYDRALQIQPDGAETWANRGAVLRELERYDDALASYQRALALNPGAPEGLYNRAIALLDLNRAEEALADCEAALTQRPDWADAWSNRGNALRRLKRLDEAVASHDRALGLAPDAFDSHYNRALALQDLKRLDEAIAGYDRAIALKPAAVDPPMTRATALLMKGDFAQGWAAYEVRWRRPGLVRIKRDFRQPLWLGKPPLDGKTILLHAEQGLGDTLHFARYVPLLAARGARAVLEVQAPLTGLMRTLEGAAIVIARGDPLPAFDHHAPLLSLPLALGTTLETIPAPAAYLHADPAKSAAWAQRLGPKSAPRVGLVWNGSAAQENDRNRSLPLAALLPYLPGGLDYVSLQAELREADRAALQASAIRHFGPELHDFTDTAALCDQMDVVVSVCTSGAHLAGALGKDTRILLTNVGVCWRWLTDRPDSPWYPSATLYRQGTDNDWTPVLERLGADLAALRP
jgi:tetratricopeptide (TPR) repeat protein